MRYRLSPFLRLHLGPDGITLENYVTHEDFALDLPGAEELLYFLSIKARTRADILQAAPISLTEGDFDHFFDEGIIVEDDDTLADALATQISWYEHGWGPHHYFNMATRDYPFIDYSQPDATNQDREIMDGYLKAGSRPANTKRCGDTATHVALPQLDSAQSSPIATVLSLPSFNVQRPRAPTAVDLSRLLFCTSGVIGSKAWPGQGTFLRRTTPSGGARHPTETYVINLRIPDIPAGIYHYNVVQHSLALASAMQTSDYEERIPHIFSDIRDRAQIGLNAVLVFSSRVERSMWRYRDSRSYRVILIDLGHVVMNFRLACEDMGVSYVCGHGFHETSVAKLLNIDLDEEPPLYAGFI